MITLLKEWKGTVEVDGVEYESIDNATSALKRLSDGMHIILHSAKKNANMSVTERSDNPIREATSGEVRITVKQYMTRHATPEFDFMAKWNNDKPMPLRTMQGTVEKETKGMVYMNLHGVAQETITCMCCGKELTNPVSRHYGIGPVCMSKVGIHCDIEDVSQITEKLVEIEWSGWIIKSSITEREEV